MAPILALHKADEGNFAVVLLPDVLGAEGVGDAFQAGTPVDCSALICGGIR
jgi:hypothetical protein